MDSDSPVEKEKEKKYTFADRNKIKHRKNEKNVSAIQKKKKK